MHRRIIELSKDPILKNERMCESSVPDWFYHSIADYTDADTDRDHDIKWFLDAVARVVDVAEDGKSFTFKPKAKQKYFERPVSYTHLDVYKRQMAALRACKEKYQGVARKGVEAIELKLQGYESVEIADLTGPPSIMSMHGSREPAASSGTNLP